MDYFSDGVGFYDAGAGVFDGVNVTDDVGVDVGILKREVGALHSAVDKLQILTVAEWLCADDTAVLKGKAFGKPSEILAFERRILNGYILTVPECVLSIEVAVAYGKSVYVLE